MTPTRFIPIYSYPPIREEHAEARPSIGTLGVTINAVLRTVLVPAIVALAGCTQIYFNRFAVDPADPSYASHVQFEDIRSYVRERGFRVEKDERDYASYQLATNRDSINPAAPSDYLELRLTPESKVELVLVRISSGPNYSDAQLKVFQDTLQTRILERTGKVISVRFVGGQRGLRAEK